MTAIDQTVADAPAVSDGVLLTDGAAQKVKALLDSEGRDDLALRIAVQPGGCSGLRYQLFFDERHLEGDVVRDFSGVQVVTDRMSAPYLRARRSTSSTPSRSRASTIDNPNATGSCACGVAFTDSRAGGFSAGARVLPSALARRRSVSARLVVQTRPAPTYRRSRPAAAAFVG